jgi:hypothetical protein
VFGTFCIGRTISIKTKGDRELDGWFLGVLRFESLKYFYILFIKSCDYDESSVLEKSVSRFKPKITCYSFYVKRNAFVMEFFDLNFATSGFLMASFCGEDVVIVLRCS